MSTQEIQKAFLKYSAPGKDSIERSRTSLILSGNTSSYIISEKAQVSILSDVKTYSHYFQIDEGYSNSTAIGINSNDLRVFCILGKYFKELGYNLFYHTKLPSVISIFNTDKIVPLIVSFAFPSCRNWSFYEDTVTSIAEVIKTLEKYKIEKKPIGCNAVPDTGFTLDSGGCYEPYYLFPKLCKQHLQYIPYDFVKNIKEGIYDSELELCKKPKNLYTIFDNLLDLKKFSDFQWRTPEDDSVCVICGERRAMFGNFCSVCADKRLYYGEIVSDIRNNKVTKEDILDGAWRNYLREY